LNYGKFGVKYAAVKIWNFIPIKIKNSCSFKTFKIKYKEYLISKYPNKHPLGLLISNYL
jgi:hypothetical protein